MGVMAADSQPPNSARPGANPIVVDGLSFALNGSNVSYRFHVDADSGDLITDHYGGPVTENPFAPIERNGGGWSRQAHFRREFPDTGRGDFRSAAVRIHQTEGHSILGLQYKSHEIQAGKPELPGLPSTFGGDDDIHTLVLHLADEISSVTADLSYSIFPKLDAIARSVTVSNKGAGNITVNKLASFSADFPHADHEMIQLQGEWSRECNRIRRKVEFGLQGFGNLTGYSSHLNNPFVALVEPSTTESHGEAWGFSLIHTGSFSVEVEKSSQSLTRVLVGTNPDQLSWPLAPGESFTSPECVSVFSSEGIGAMSRKYHRLFRKHLITSKWVNKPRPLVLNSWEGLYFDFDADRIYQLAQASAEIGAKIFVLDDGWFGEKYPRVNDQAGLGDWVANPKRFPDGLDSLGKKITKLQVANSQEKLQFGLWVEPEMVNPKSKLYEDHPDWAMHAGSYPRTEARHQLVLNISLPEVQDYIIKSISDILETVPITFIKWDNNRGVHETSAPHIYHANILGLYRVLRELTSRFPDVLWEGCASGGARFDPGIMHYFPQTWTSDNTDALDRIPIQFGTSLVYPPSAMSAHISQVPNHLTRRTTSITFRAHVAMMTGSFGFELDPEAIPEDDKKLLPELLALAEKVNPVIIGGDMWRLNLPETSNLPAALYISEDGNQAVLFVFHMHLKTLHSPAVIRLQGLDPAAFYKLDGGESYSGATLMNGGLQYRFKTDCESKVVFLEKQ